MTRALVLGVLLVVLAGCVSREGTFTHPDGRTAQCSAAGFGLVWALAALNQYDTCRESYLRAGYVGG